MFITQIKKIEGNYIFTDNEKFKTKTIFDNSYVGKMVEIKFRISKLKNLTATNIELFTGGLIEKNNKTNMYKDGVKLCENENTKIA